MTKLNGEKSEPAIEDDMMTKNGHLIFVISQKESEKSLSEFFAHISFFLI